MKSLNSRPKESSSRGLKILIFFGALIFFWFVFISKRKDDNGDQEVR